MDGINDLTKEDSVTCAHYFPIPRAGELRYATAEVPQRIGNTDSCGEVNPSDESQPVQILSLAREPTLFHFNTTPLPHRWIAFGRKCRARYNRDIIGWVIGY
jgi:hypothetical protein